MAALAVSESKAKLDVWSPTPLCRSDLTWLFWTKLCEKLSLERSFGYAEEEVQR